MEHLASTIYSLTYKAENECKEASNCINKLIDELGQKLEKNLVQMQEKMLLDFKENLLYAQRNYRDLKKERNEEIIKQKILNLKTEKEKIFSEEQVKSLQMNKIYDKLKLDMKHSNQYQHELTLQIKYLTKQCMVAKKKGELLEQEIKEYESNLKKSRTIKTEPQNHYLPRIKKRKSHLRQTQSELGQSIAEKRAKAKAQALKEFMQMVEVEETELQKLVGKYEIQSFRNGWQKLNLIEKIIGDPEFKRFLYRIMFKKEKHAASLISDKSI